MSAVAVAQRVEGAAGAPVLLLSNSLASNLEMWEPQLPALRERFQVVRYDHRGHGGSPVPPGPYELDDLGADALALLDQLSVPRTHICGLSLGGMVGMWLAINAPERVDRVVLCCTSARLGPPSMWAGRAERARRDGTASLAEETLGRWLTPGFAREHPDLGQCVSDMISATPSEGYAACCGAIERMNLEPELLRITAPTLVIAAAEDPSTPPEHGERIAARIPGARLVVLQDAAHLANVQQPARVSELVLEHLAPGVTRTRGAE